MITSTTMPSRKFVKIVRSFPDRLLSQSLLDIETDACHALRKHRRIIWAAFISIFLAVLLPVFDSNNSQTISRQLISPFAAFIISIWIFFQITFPLKPTVRLGDRESNEFEMLQKFVSLEHRPYKLVDEESTEGFCMVTLNALSEGIRSHEDEIERLLGKIQKEKDESSKTKLEKDLESRNSDLETLRKLFDEHFDCWSWLNLIKVDKKFFFPKQPKLTDSAHPQSSTTFRH